MPPNTDSNYTFLAWNPEEQSEAEKYNQLFRRHQHTALATHRKKKKLKPPSEQHGRPSETRTSQLRSGNSIVTRIPDGSWSVRTAEYIAERQTQMSLRASPGADRVDPFDACCVSGISICAQMMLQSGMFTMFRFLRGQADRQRSCINGPTLQRPPKNKMWRDGYHSP